MRIRNLFILTSLISVVACGGDDDGDTDPTLGGTDPGSESSSASATLTTTTTPGTESGSEDTLTTTDPDTGSESGSESGSADSGSSGPADSSESGSESGGVSVCEQYCDAYATNCSDPELSTQYADADACLAACATWPAGTAEDTSGNTQGCHLYHVNAAAGDAATHCPHTQEVPEGGCV